MSPKITYLVSSYNSGRFLNEHLQDLQNQIDPNFEVIVVVPDSPDTDRFVAEGWSRRDKRIRTVFKTEKEPYGSSWLTAWELARGEFVVNSNTDDFHHPRFTEIFYDHMSSALKRCPYTAKQAGILRVGPPVGFSYAGIMIRSERGHITSQGYRPQFDRDLFTRECHCGPQVCWRNDTAFRYDVDWGLMWERSREYTSAFDYWLWLYFMSLGYNGSTIDQILTIYTQRSDSLENRNKCANNYETFASISEFFPHHFGTTITGLDEFKDFSNLPNRMEWINSA